MAIVGHWTARRAAAGSPALLPPRATPGGGEGSRYFPPSGDEPHFTGGVIPSGAHAPAHLALQERTMSNTPRPLDDDELPEDAPPAPEAKDADDRESSGAPAWFISGAVHVLFAMIFWAVVFAASAPETELPPILISDLDVPPKPVEKTPIDHTLEPKIEINVREDDHPAPVDLVTIDHEERTTSDTDVEADSPQGIETAVANVETGGSGAFLAIGAAAGSSGRNGLRTGGGKFRAIATGGGSRRSENAVDAALRWFKRHQSANGMWDVEKYPLNCSEAPKCEPGSTGDSGGSDANVAMTGYALLCYLCAGYDHKTPSKYKATVQKGLDYLHSVQKADGLMGTRNYEHAVATMALAEAYAMTQDPDLKTPAQNGIKVILSRQNVDAKAVDAQYSGLGWDYTDPKPERNDSSVSGWNVMALKSGLAGGLNIGYGLEGAKKWLERAWKSTNKDWAKLSDPYTATSSFPYTWDAISNQVQIDPPGSQNHDMAPVGALCAVFLGHHAGDIMLESLVNHIMQYQLPTSYPCNTYYLYYNTLAVFQAGGERWTKWNGTVRDMLVNAQRKGEGCFDGSWDWEGTKFHGNTHGRVLSTAYCCLCLEVYYHWAHVFGETYKAH
jgi:hypothetical protein